MCEESSTPYQWEGAMTAVEDEGEAMKEINGCNGIKMMLKIDMKNNPTVAAKVRMEKESCTHLLYRPTLIINSCKYEVKYKVWVV